MNEACGFIVDEHRARLRGSHTPRREGRPRRFPRLLARFNYREPRRPKKGGR